MAAIANKYNKKAAHYTYNFPKEPYYKKLEELYDPKNPEQVFMVYGLYINRSGKYGDQAIAATDADVIINLPNHLLEDVKLMREDDELTEAINHDKVGMKIRPYQVKGKRGTFYTVEWVDL